MKKHIPNLLTLGNLFCGTVAVLFAVKGDFYVTALLVALGIFFDFFDGFVARLLNVQGELGKQLDSLADMVTSGVVPGIVMLKLLEISLNTDAVGYFGIVEKDATGSYLPYLGLLLTLGAGYRLAKFNIDTRQTDTFLGIPTPAMCLFIISLPLILEYSTNSFVTDIILNKWVLIFITILFTVLMNMEVRLFSLKFKGFSFKDNALQYLFILATIIVVLLLKTIAIPIIILLYVFVSIIKNMISK